jgi:hypothetical protein
MPKKGKCYAVIKKGKNKGKYCHEVNEYCKNAYHRGYKVKLKHNCDVCGLEFSSKFKFNSHIKSQLCVPIGVCIKCNNKQLEIDALKKTIETLNQEIKTLTLKIDNLTFTPKESNEQMRDMLLSFLNQI